MKKIGLLLLLALQLVSCEQGLEKPDAFIEEDKMVAILYDIAVMDALKSYNLNSPTANPVDSREYLLKKYQVDSLQFAQNNQYYAADMVRYKKMFEKVNQLLEAEKKKYEAEALKTGNQKPIQD
jgi:hypothetical protein